MKKVVGVGFKDVGKIYYFNLGADAYNKLEDVQDGNVVINNIHLINIIKSSK